MTMKKSFLVGGRVERNRGCFKGMFLQSKNASSLHNGQCLKVYPIFIYSLTQQDLLEAWVNVHGIQDSREQWASGHGTLDSQELWANGLGIQDFQEPWEKEIT